MALTTGSSSMMRSISTLAWMKSPSVDRRTVPLMPIRQCSLVLQQYEYHTRKEIQLSKKKVNCSYRYREIQFSQLNYFQSYRVRTALGSSMPVPEFLLFVRIQQMSSHLGTASRGGQSPGKEYFGISNTEQDASRIGTGTGL